MTPKQADKIIAAGQARTFITIHGEVFTDKFTSRDRHVIRSAHRTFERADLRLVEMATFSIYNVITAEDLGTYDARNADHALDVMAQSYGFKDYVDCVREYGISVEDARSELQITLA